MNLRKKLHIFEMMVRAEAEDHHESERRVIASQYDAAYAAILKEADEAAQKRFDAELRKTELAKNKKILQASTESKKELYQLKENLADEIFGGVYNKISHFTESREYPAYIVKKINEIKSGAGNGRAAVTEVVLRSADLCLAGIVSKECGLNVSESPEDFYGGFLLKIGGKNAVIDMSFKTKIEDIRKNYQMFGSAAGN